MIERELAEKAQDSEVVEAETSELAQLVEKQV